MTSLLLKWKEAEGVSLCKGFPSASGEPTSLFTKPFSPAHKSMGRTLSLDKTKLARLLGQIYYFYCFLLSISPNKPNQAPGEGRSTTERQWLSFYCAYCYFNLTNQRYLSMAELPSRGKVKDEGKLHRIPYHVFLIFVKII